MIPVRRLVALLSLAVLLLQGIVAQPVTTRLCLRAETGEHCIAMANAVARYGEHAAPIPALLPAEIAPPARPQPQGLTLSAPDWRQAAQTERGPQIRPPRAAGLA